MMKLQYASHPLSSMLHLPSQTHEVYEYELEHASCKRWLCRGDCLYLVGSLSRVLGVL